MYIRTCACTYVYIMYSCIFIHVHTVSTHVRTYMCTHTLLAPSSTGASGSESEEEEDEYELWSSFVRLR